MWGGIHYTLGKELHSPALWETKAAQHVAVHMDV